jgi:hypothetical protein
VPTLDAIGLSPSNVEHAFFLQCYMKYPADPSFCKDGHLDNSSSVISLPLGGDIPPRASVLKCTPRKFRKMFLAQKASQTISEVSNTSLNLSQGGGLSDTNKLPIELHQLLARFCHGKLFKNPNVPLATHFVSYIQNGLTDLDASQISVSCLQILPAEVASL